MTDTKITARGLAAAGAVLALLAAAALPLGAAAQQVPAQPDQPTAVVPDAMTVVRDPGTGKFRAASSEEQATMRAATAGRRVRAAAAAAPETNYHSSGAIGVTVTDDMATNMAMAVRNAKGGIELLCVEPGHAGAVHTAASHKAQPVEE